MPDTGIIVVTYNSAGHIGACLDAALETGAEIVVVDNASSDSTVAEVKQRPVRLIANQENRGFAAAANQAFVVLNSQYVLLLNPDAILRSTLDPLREACDLPQSAGAGGRLVDANGRPQTGFMVRALPTPAALILEALVLNRVWPENPVNRRYRCLHQDLSIRCEVEQPAGAFLMVRRVVWEELGGLDERYFPLWFEDVDFCRRLQDRGFRLYYVPEAVAIHTGGHSIGQLGVEMRAVYWYRSLLRYSSKHFGRGAFRAVCLSVVTGSVFRSIAVSVWQRSLRPFAAYVKVAWLAGRGLMFGSLD
ncbi:MAG TPA: glycosyltransferase family 2 protein [Candidatus Acidoferrales bacterium]|nr:glycosyltransferase family 2 protein [Candidatus Acidoferrales bacterium]